jgi:hypothetical protein
MNETAGPARPDVLAAGVLTMSEKHRSSPEELAGVVLKAHHLQDQNAIWSSRYVRRPAFLKHGSNRRRAVRCMGDELDAALAI